MRFYTDGHWRSVWDVLCNLSHLTACDWITRDVNTRCKQGHRDLWEAYVSCSLCCFPSECSVISRSMRACWLIIQSSLVFPLVHSAQKTKEARNQCYGRVWLRPNLHPMINDPPLSAHLTLSLSRVKWAEDNNKQCKTKQIHCPLSPHLHTPTWSIEWCTYTHIHTASVLWMHRLWRMQSLISRLKVNFQ